MARTVGPATGLLLAVHAVMHKNPAEIEDITNIQYSTNIGLAKHSKRARSGILSHPCIINYLLGGFSNCSELTKLAVSTTRAPSAISFGAMSSGAVRDLFKKFAESREKVSRNVCQRTRAAVDAHCAADRRTLAPQINLSTLRHMVDGIRSEHLVVMASRCSGWRLARLASNLAPLQRNHPRPRPWSPSSARAWLCQQVLPSRGHALSMGIGGERQGLSVVKRSPLLRLSAGNHGLAQQGLRNMHAHTVARVFNNDAAYAGRVLDGIRNAANLTPRGAVHSRRRGG